MIGWHLVVDLTRALVFAAAHLCGNSLGGGIVAFSLVVRVALLPLALRVARRQLEHQARLKALEPEMATLRKLHGTRGAALAEATLALHRRHDISLMPRGTVTPMLIQAPIGAAVYGAIANGVGRQVRFLWISDLARPDAFIAAGAAFLAGAATAAVPSAGRIATLVSTAITFALAWRLSASVGLYWFAANGVGLVQSLIVRRRPA